MKITDVQLTLFAWDDIPVTTYGRHTGRFSGTSQLGLVTIATDQGVQGHAFLGIEVDRQGFVHAVDEPGLGAEIDFALIERKKVAVLS